MGVPEEGSVLAPLEGFAWDSEEAAAYEAAVEATDAAVGGYSARIAAEERRPAGTAPASLPRNAGRPLTPQRSAPCGTASPACARARERLDPTDTSQITEARCHHSALARSLTERQNSHQLREIWDVTLAGFGRDVSDGNETTNREQLGMAVRFGPER